MDEDPLDDLLNLEEGFYRQGYDLGNADGAHAGLVEGKLFGVEKGFEKALEMGRLAGRAQVWQQRLPASEELPTSQASVHRGSVSPDHQGIKLREVPTLCVTEMPLLSKNARLGRHIDNLNTSTSSVALSNDNSDQAVADFDERFTRAMAKAKVIANIVAEPLRADELSRDEKSAHGHVNGNGSIEEASNLSARH